MTDVGVDGGDRVVERRRAIPALIARVPTDALFAVVLILMWLIGQGFPGIDHDATIYMGRALADLDPDGVGRDMIFALDGQSAFTVFRPVARTLVATFGLGPTVAILSVVNLAAWFVAIVALARTLVPGRAALLVLAVALALPRIYTPWHLIAAGEPFPIPRPLAETGVLLAVAALCRGRNWLAVLCLASAALFHPIMAAPGLGVLLLVFGRRDRRWLIGAGLLGGAIAAAAALGAPLASRLFATIDPTWRAILVERNPYLFVHLWPAETFGMLSVQVVTILVASSHLEGRARAVMQAAVAVGALGTAASFVLGDGLANLLVLQAQLWRALWLPAALAPIAAGICLWRLPARGGIGQITLALLALAWVAANWLPFSAVAAALALGVQLLARDRAPTISRSMVVAVWAFVGVLSAVLQAMPLAALVEMWATMPQGISMPLRLLWTNGLMMVPASLLAWTLWRWREQISTKLLATLAIVAGLIALPHLDTRQPPRADADAGRLKPDLAKLLPATQREILWLRGDDIWYWLRRPNWDGHTHGGPLVFSRQLAMKWLARTSMMRRHGLATDATLAPWTSSEPEAPIDVFAADLAGFCSEPDAPSAIVAPVERDQSLPHDRGIRLWSPGLTSVQGLADGHGFRWQLYDRFAIIPCADHQDVREAP